jgi:hypothetical protein
MFSTFFMDTCGNWIIITLFVIMYVTLFIIGALLAAFLNPGVVNSVDRHFKGEKIEFGDVFRYGRSVFKDYIGLVLLNMLVTTLIMGIALGLIGILFLLLIIRAPLIMCFGLVIFLPLMILISMIIFPVQYLVFIIRYKEGASSLDCIMRSYAFVFRNFGFCMVLVSIVFVFTVAVSTVPFLSIALSLFMLTFMHTLFLHIYYEMGA